MSNPTPNQMKFPRYFKHRSGFPVDGLETDMAFLCCETEFKTTWNFRDGRKETAIRDDWFNTALEFVSKGIWLEITAEQAAEILKGEK